MQQQSQTTDTNSCMDCPQSLSYQSSQLCHQHQSFLPPLLISDEARLSIRNFLRKKFSGDDEGICFFRRFDRLILNNQNPLSITRHFGLDVYETLENVEGLNPEIIKKNIDIRYKHYSGFTDSRQLRREHPSIFNKEVYLHSSCYRHLDFSNDYTFKFEDVKRVGSHPTPQNGDLIYIFMHKVDFICTTIIFEFSCEIYPEITRLLLVNKKCGEVVCNYLRSFHEADGKRYVTTPPGYIKSLVEEKERSVQKISACDRCGYYGLRKKVEKNNFRICTRGCKYYCENRDCDDFGVSFNEGWLNKNNPKRCGRCIESSVVLKKKRPFVYNHYCNNCDYIGYNLRATAPDSCRKCKEDDCIVVRKAEKEIECQQRFFSSPNYAKCMQELTPEESGSCMITSMPKYHACDDCKNKHYKDMKSLMWCDSSDDDY